MTEKPRAADPDVTGSAPGGSASAEPAVGQQAERVVIHDRRKIHLDGSDGGSAKPAADAEPSSTEPSSTEPKSTEPSSTEPADAADPTAEAAAGEAAVEIALAEDSEEIAEAVEAEVAGASGGDSPVVDAPAEPIEQVEPAERAEPVEPVEAPAAGRTGPLGAELAALRSELDERTRDLQRVTAEYANYRKRVDRDRGLVAEQTTGTVLATLLPVLDDLDRAREHGDLVGPFGTVAEQLTGAVGKLGLTAFGEKGDPFDPTRHEAVAHLTSADVTEPTCIDVMRRGYLLGERLLRPALVAVADPE